MAGERDAQQRALGSSARARWRPRATPRPPAAAATPPRAPVAVASSSATSTAAAIPVTPSASGTPRARCGSMAGTCPIRRRSASPPTAARRSLTPPGARTTWPSPANVRRRWSNVGATLASPSATRVAASAERIVSPVTRSRSLLQRLSGIGVRSRDRARPLSRWAPQQREGASNAPLVDPDLGPRSHRARHGLYPGRCGRAGHTGRGQGPSGARRRVPG